MPKSQSHARCNAQFGKGPQQHLRNTQRSKKLKKEVRERFTHHWLCNKCEPLFEMVLLDEDEDLVEQ